MPFTITKPGTPVGRKFRFAAWALALSFVLALIGRIDGGAWTAIVTLLSGIYVAGNVAQKATAKNGPPQAEG